MQSLLSNLHTEVHEGALGIMERYNIIMRSAAPDQCPTKLGCPAPIVESPKPCAHILPAAQFPLPASQAAAAEKAAQCTGWAPGWVFDGHPQMGLLHPMWLRAAAADEVQP